LIRHFHDYGKGARDGKILQYENGDRLLFALFRVNGPEQ
jgi:hypothetical protein